MTKNTVLADWFDRRCDAVEDAMAVTNMAIRGSSPADIAGAQLRFLSLSFARMAADASAWQELVAMGIGMGMRASDGTASRVAAQTRAAGQPLREARDASSA